MDRDGKFKYSQSVEAEIGVAPKLYELSQNYPNPFNPTTVISYQIPLYEVVDLNPPLQRGNERGIYVTLMIYDVLGREVATLVNEEQSAGWKEVEWNASSVSSGIYFYRLTAGTYVGTKKLMLLK